MNNDIKNFIEENITKIDANYWEEIYKDLKHTDVQLRGQFTAFMLDADIDPAIYLEYIPDYYLFGCGIKEYIITDAITSIGYGAFANCSSLTSIEIPDNVTSIGAVAFSNCSSLTDVTIPNSVTSIGGYIFAGCISLIEIKYLGTKKEAIKLGIGNRSNDVWRINSAILKIICTDGEILL